MRVQDSTSVYATGAAQLAQLGKEALGARRYPLHVDRVERRVHSIGPLSGSICTTSSS